jgi:DNA-binding SARP family transcriptional activator
MPDSTVKLMVLGGAALVQHRAPLAGPATHRHRLALRALLAASRKPVARDKLVALLWPDKDTPGARNLLKVALPELRKALGEGSIVTVGNALAMDAAVLPSDVGEFAAALERGDPEEAVRQYGGPFLDGFHLPNAMEFEHWMDGERARLAAACAGALERLAARESQPASAAHWLRRLSDHDPLSSDVSLRLMQALAAAGNAAAAVRHAEDSARYRREQMDLDPDPQVEALARALAEAPPAIPLPPVAAPAPRVAPIESHPPPAAPGAAAEPRPPATIRSSSGRVALLAFATVIAGAVISFGLLRSERALPIRPGTVAVLPFHVAPRDSNLAHVGPGMVDLLSARLGDPELGFDPVAPRVTLAAGPDSISLDSALAVARRARAEYAITGSIASPNGATGMEIAAFLYDVTSRAQRGSTVDTLASLDDLPGLVNRLAIGLLAAAAHEPVDRLADLRMHPPVAVQLYLAARRAYVSGALRAADSLYVRALAADSTFALAALGRMLAADGDTTATGFREGRDVARRQVQTLSARDRAFLLALTRHGPEDPARLIAAWDTVTRQWPDFADAWYSLARAYRRYAGFVGFPTASVPVVNSLRRAVTADPAFQAPLRTLVEVTALRSERDGLDTLARNYFAARPDSEWRTTAAGWAAATGLKDRRRLAELRSGLRHWSSRELTRIVLLTQSAGADWRDADSALAELGRRARTSEDRRRVAELTYVAALNAGRDRDARAAAESLGGIAGDSAVTAMWELYAALFGESAPDSQLVRTAAARLTNETPSSAAAATASCLAGYGRLLEKDVAAAERQATRARRSPPGGDAELCGRWLAAAIAVERDQPDAIGLIARVDTALRHDRRQSPEALAAAMIVTTRLQARAAGRGSYDLSLLRETHGVNPFFLSTELLLHAREAAKVGGAEFAVKAYTHYLALRSAPDNANAARTVLEVRAALDSIR